MASTVCDACLSCRGESVTAGLADGVSAAVVFVVGGDVADAGVQPDGVVLDPDAVEFGGKVAGVTDLLQVRPVAFDMPEQRLDPGLVGRGAGAARSAA